MRTFRSIAPPPAAVHSAPDFLAVASAIGTRLVREAVWYRRQCSWIGLDTAAAYARERPRPAHRSLGPGLADGTAGIALFLAQLHACGAGEEVRQTARGAIGQALAHAGELPAGGLYGGRLGVAYAAASCGALLGDERLTARAGRLARGRGGSASASGEFDLFTGAAGTVAALLALARRLGDDRLVAAAARPADELLAAAGRSAVGWSWPPPDAPTRHGLCGLAHGAAGAAWALLELFAVTGEARHRDGALRALDYERAWFDAAQAAWPDLRGVQRSEPRGSFRCGAGPASWSRGTAGIALSRLRAWEILGDERARDEATVALRTTAASVERALQQPSADFSLGEGVAGRADALLLGAALHPEGGAIAVRAADVGNGRHGASLTGWPGALPGARTPALLNGDAGIGLFFLRLHDPNVPSALLPGAHSPR